MCYSLIRVLLLGAPWTVACQAPLSMAFSRQEYWSGLPFPSPGDLPHAGIKPGFPALQANSLSCEKIGGKVAWLCPTFYDPVHCSLPGSSHGIFQARVPEWVAISFSRGPSLSRDRTRVSHIVGRCFTI